MPLFFIFIVYNIVQIIALPGIVIYLVLRRIKGKPTFGNLWERIGLVPHSKQNKNVVWLHAVSVGEVLSLHGVISALKKTNPNVLYYVTTGTLTGKAMAQQKLDVDYASLLPFDFLPCMLLAFRRIKPTSLIIIEAELWPNFLAIAKWNNVPTTLLNARISSRSSNRYKKLAPFLHPLLKTFKHIYTQTEHDTKAFSALGIDTNRVTTSGNIKVLSVVEKHERAPQVTIAGKQENDIVLLAGSIHPSEDKIYLRLFQKLKPDFPNLKLILAPRHFHWKETLIKNVAQTNYSYNIWDENPGDLKSDVTLICMLGILFDMYRYADFFFLGGTFVPIGGHNLLEPAVWGIPSLVGPHYHNTTHIANELEQHKALIKVANEDELLLHIQQWLTSKTISGEHAQRWIRNEHTHVQSVLSNLI